MSLFGDKITTINISTLTFVKILILTGVAGFLFLIHDVVAILFISLLFASALSPLVGSMERRGMPRGVSIFLIYLSVISVILLVILLIIPPLVEQYNQLVLTFPQYSERALAFFRSVSPDGTLLVQVKNAFGSIQSNVIQATGTLFLKLFDVVKGIIAFFIVFVVTFYMVAEERRIRRMIHAVTPERYRSYVDHLAVRIQEKVGLWLRGQLFLCLIIFCFSYIGLTILGVEYALILALVAGLTEFIPIVGPFLGAVPALFIAGIQSPILALWVLLLYLVIQRLENDLLVPRVMQHAVGINPLISIIALLIGAKIGGVVGMLLAIPVTTVIGVVMSDFFQEDEEET